MTPAPSNLWEMIEAVVAHDPSAPALVFADETVSFGQLKDEAERCAAWLAERGLRRGDVAALQLPKRRDTYPLWLACLRQGLVYVFLDVRNPPERTARILDRTRPALLVTTGETSNDYGQTVSFSGSGDPRTWLEGLPAPAGAPPPAKLHGLDPAYIMFTSGSTGEPKGAVIPHQGVLSLVRWAGNTVLPAAGWRFSNINPLHFDNSVFDLYCGLLNGAALVPVETAALANPASWVRRLREGGASVIFAVPTLFQTLNALKLLRPESLPDARVFVFGGEGFPIPALRAFHARFAGRARLINVYGPTETSCICSSLEIDAAALDAAGDGLASLGRMHPDFDHAVLDETGAPVPTGEAGELWIGGACVGLGYYDNPEETAARFQQDPRQNRYRSTWYRSGDLVREDEEGLLWFQGRVDNQVKVRGHRIELEEVDLAVEAVPGVLRAVCVATAGVDGPELRVAFAAAHEVAPDTIRAVCAEKLPSYMQPSHIVQLEILPQNANGKVDRKAVRRIVEGHA